MRLFCARCATIPKQVVATIIDEGQSLCYEHFKMNHPRLEEKEKDN